MNLSPSFQVGKSWLWHALFFGLLLLIQIALALFRDLPLVTADESVYLAHARFFSGAAPMPTLYGSHFFAFGYSLFLVPAFWLFESPTTAYTASLVISAFLMSTLYLILYYVLVCLLGISSRLAMFVAFITCLYPPLLLRANFAWAENAYMPGFMLLIALFGTLLRQKSLRLALLFGLLLGCMYTIHARSLPLIPIAAIYLAVLGYFRVLRWRVVAASLTATTLVLVSTRIVVNYLKLQSESGIPEMSMSAVIAHLLSLQGLHDVVHMANMQVLQVIQSSFGLFLVGLLAVGHLLWKRLSNSPASFTNDVATATLTFFILAWMGTLALAAAHLANPIQHVFFLLGRYVDGISALFLALGLSAVLSAHQRYTSRQGLVLIALVAVSTLVAVLGLSQFVPATSVPFSIGIYPFLALLDSSPALICASAVAIVGFAVLVLATGRIRIMAVLAITVLFLLTSAYDYRFGILPLQDRVARTSTLASYIRTYLGSPPAIAYDTTYYHPLTYFTYEYLLPHTRFIPFDGAAGEKPPADIVISGSRWQEAETLGAQFWQVEPAITTVGANQALWTLPGPQQSGLLQQVDYTNTVLGVATLPAWGIDTPQGRPVQSVWAVWQRSFYHVDIPETTIAETSIVWFDADAALRVPYRTPPPRAILLNFVNPAGEGKPLQIDVNGENLFAGAIPPGNWCEAFPLPVGSGGSVNVELSRPTRELLLVHGIALLDHVPDMQLRDVTADPLPASGYRSQLALESPLYPQTLARSTMGTVRISVTNSSDQTWPTSCEIGNSLGVVQLGILWFPKNSTDRTLSARVAEGRAALPYALAPGSGITLTAILAPIKQNGDLLPPGEYEVWIGPVQEGVRWFFQEGDEVLTIPVRIVR